jgi:6-phosphogluconolactonase
MLKSWDARRDYIIPGNTQETLAFAATHWIHSAERAIQQRGRFAVALSGGSTPKAIYELLVKTGKLDWSKIWLFWSDERAVPPDHPDSNYRMAMESFQKVPIPPSQIFRMAAEKEIEKNALDYEQKIQHILGKDLFDLVMLGIGEDGHTASLFPNTKALTINNRLVIPNYISEKNCWRMTLTFSCINQSFHSVIYAIGASKQFIVPQALEAPIESAFPASKIGTVNKKNLWIIDNSSAINLK